LVTGCGSRVKSNGEVGVAVKALGRRLAAYGSRPESFFLLCWARQELLNDGGIEIGA